jgi:hypothetical protein
VDCLRSPVFLQPSLSGFQPFDPWHNVVLPFTGLTASFRSPTVIVSCGLTLNQILLAACLRSSVFLRPSLSSFLVGIALIQPSISDAFNLFYFLNSSLHLEFEGDVRIFDIILLCCLI